MSEDKSRQQKAEEFKEFFLQKMGEATMCWEPIPSGVFDSTKCMSIADEILERFKKDGENWHIQNYRTREFEAWVTVDKLRLENQKLNTLIDQARPWVQKIQNDCDHDGSCYYETWLNTTLNLQQTT